MDNKANIKKLRALVKKRQAHFESMRANNDGSHKMIANQYSDKTHFIYEILQNANDANATSVDFNLKKESIDITHDGSELFNYKHIESITTVADSTKVGDYNKIGEYGAGFKSVFAITKTPIIRSGAHRFKINNFIVPELINSKFYKATDIILPFNISNGEVNQFDKIEKRLSNIGLKTLLFLSDIKKIEWKTPSKRGYYLKTEKSYHPKFDNVKRVSITATVNQGKLDEDYSEEYIVFKKFIEIDNDKLEIDVAYSILIDDDDNIEIVPISHEQSKLSVYFPTERDTFLNFIIQGPFITTPNRENIPLDHKTNKLIIDEIANLVGESMILLKDMNILSPSVIDKVLPIDDEFCDRKIYGKFYNRVKEQFLSDNKLLPKSNSGFSHPDESIFANNKDLISILKKKDIQFLYDKSHWLDPNITTSKTPLFRSYLINTLKVQEITFPKFCKMIDKEFMKLKSDQWIIDFYNKVNQNENLYIKQFHWYGDEPVLKNKPIIRTRDGKNIAPYNEKGKIQVFLPDEKDSSYKTVKKSITKDAIALEFLKKLGLSKPDIFSEINEYILPKYRSDIIDISTKDYIKDIGKIIYAINEKDVPTKQLSLIDDLKELKIIDVHNIVTGENCFMKPSEVYLNNKNVKQYFDGYNGAYFITGKLYKNFKKEVFEDFALKIGCNDKPRKVEIEGDLSYKEMHKIRDSAGKAYIRTKYIKDYDIHGLENFLSNVKLETSVLMLNYIIRSISGLNSFVKQQEYFQAEYCWTPRSRLYYHNFDAKFKKLLSEKKWLYDNKGNQVKPSKISISDLAKDYSVDNEYYNILEDVFLFKLDLIRQLEKKTGWKAIHPDEFALYEDFKNQRLNTEDEDNISENDDWEPDVNPENESIDLKEALLERNEIDDLKNQDIVSSSVLEEIRSEREVYKDKDEDDEDGIPEDKIGELGERWVFQYLTETRFKDIKNKVDTYYGFSGNDKSNNFIEVNWLNKNQNVGRGYDFVILENGVEIEYIEVKATIKSGKVLHKVQGTQWEFARKLFHEGNGDKYKIYSLKNVNSKDPEMVYLSNPFKLWKEGRLYAHPIQIKV